MNVTPLRFFTPLALLEWGLILIYFFVSHRIATFLHPHFHALVLISGLLLVTTALISVCFPHPSCGCELDDDHHTLPSVGKVVLNIAILLLPISWAAMASPDHLSVNLIRNHGLIETSPPSCSRPAAPPSSTFPTPAHSNSKDQHQNPALIPDKDGYIHAEVTDILYASADPSMRSDYEGKKVSLIGQVAHHKEAQTEKGPFQLVRFVMVCCVADLKPLAVLVDYPNNLKPFNAMTWVKVIGIASFKPSGSIIMPIIKPERIIPIEAPPDLYLN